MPEQQTDSICNKLYADYEHLSLQEFINFTPDEYEEIEDMLREELCRSDLTDQREKSLNTLHAKLLIIRNITL